MIEALRLSDRLIDLADGDPTKGNLIFGSPLSTAIAMRGHVKMCLGIPGWQDDAAASIAMAAPLDPTSYVFALLWKYVASIPFGALPAGCDRHARDRRGAAHRREFQRRLRSRNGPTQLEASSWLVAKARNARRASTCSPKPTMPPWRSGSP